MSGCVESRGFVCAGFVGTVVDPDDAGGCWCLGWCSESFGVLKVVPLPRGAIHTMSRAMKNGAYSSERRITRSMLAVPLSLAKCA